MWICNNLKSWPSSSAKKIIKNKKSYLNKYYKYFVGISQKNSVY